MAMAIQSAALAAPLLVRELRGELDPDTMEREWIISHESLFAGRIRWSRRVAWLLCRPGFIELAMRLHLPAGVGKALLEKTRATSAQIDGLVRAIRRTVDPVPARDSA